jgi:hypothetical protein
LPYFEAFTEAKNPLKPETNEDQIVLVPGSVYAVIDGATDITGKRWDDELGHGATGGRLAGLAIAKALRDFAAGPLQTLPEPGEVFPLLTEAVAALYRRLGIFDEAKENRQARFRATLAAAFIAGDRLRVMRVGDSGIRVNGDVQLAFNSPAEAVLVTLRAETWALLAERGVAEDERRRTTTQVVLEGIGAAGLAQADVEALLARSLAHERVQEALPSDAEGASWIMRNGLKGLRKTPRGFTATVIDGIGDPSDVAAVQDFDLAAIETLELFSDGYPGLPEGRTVADWEKVQRHADDTDPDRIGAYAAIKGKIGSNSNDDRSMLIVKIAP